MLAGGFNWIFLCSSLFGEMIPNLTSIFFQMAWNHQLENDGTLLWIIFTLIRGVNKWWEVLGIIFEEGYFLRSQPVWESVWNCELDFSFWSMWEHHQNTAPQEHGSSHDQRLGRRGFCTKVKVIILKKMKYLPTKGGRNPKMAAIFQWLFLVPLGDILPIGWLYITYHLFRGTRNNYCISDI